MKDLTKEYINKGFNPFYVEERFLCKSMEEVISVYKKYNDGDTKPYVLKNGDGKIYCCSVSSGCASVAVLFNCKWADNKNENVFGKTQVPNMGQGALTKYWVNIGFATKANHILKGKTTISIKTEDRRKQLYNLSFGEIVDRFIKIYFNRKIDFIKRKRYSEEIITVTEGCSSSNYTEHRMIDNILLKEGYKYEDYGLGITY